MMSIAADRWNCATVVLNQCKDVLKTDDSQCVSDARLSLQHSSDV